MALVRAKETVFYDGHRRRAGDVFEFNGKIEGNKAIELVAETEVKEEVKEPVKPTIEQLREKLNGYGVKFGPNTSYDKLAALVAEAEGKEE